MGKCKAVDITKEVVAELVTAGSIKDNLVVKKRMSTVVMALSKSMLSKRMVNTVDAGLLSRLEKIESAQDSKRLDNILNEGSTPTFDTMPNYDGVPRMIYAGVGSRNTPPEVLEEMEEVAKELEERGYKLNTGTTFRGREEGADGAFSKGTENKALFGPEKYGVGKEVQAIVDELHPASKNLKDGGRKLMARNTHQIFGENLDTPVDFVLFYAKETSNPLRPEGGTGQAVEMARRKGIPTINMAEADWRAKLDGLVETAEELSPIEEGVQDVISTISTAVNELEDSGIDEWGKRIKPLAEPIISLITGLSSEDDIDVVYDALTTYSTIETSEKGHSIVVHVAIEVAQGIKIDKNSSDLDVSKSILADELSSKLRKIFKRTDKKGTTKTNEVSTKGSKRTLKLGNTTIEYNVVEPAENRPLATTNVKTGEISIQEGITAKRLAEYLSRGDNGSVDHTTSTRRKVLNRLKKEYGVDFNDVIKDLNADSSNQLVRKFLLLHEYRHTLQLNKNRDGFKEAYKADPVKFELDADLFALNALSTLLPSMEPTKELKLGVRPTTEKGNIYSKEVDKILAPIAKGLLSDDIIKAIGKGVHKDTKDLEGLIDNLVYNAITEYKLFTTIRSTYEEKFGKLSSTEYNEFKRFSYDAVEKLREDMVSKAVAAITTKEEDAVIADLLTQDLRDKLDAAGSKQAKMQVLLNALRIDDEHMTDEEYYAANDASNALKDKLRDVGISLDDTSSMNDDRVKALFGEKISSEDRYTLQGKFQANKGQKELIDLTVDLLEGNSKAIEDNVLVVQGMGGTGKSTTIGRAIEIAAEGIGENNVTVMGMTITHSAKGVLKDMMKTMSESITKTVSTIASGLGTMERLVNGQLQYTGKGYREAEPFSNGKIYRNGEAHVKKLVEETGRSRKSKLVIVVDETSMIDASEYATLLGYVKEGEGKVKLVLMGDYHQMPIIDSHNNSTRVAKNAKVGVSASLTNATGKSTMFDPVVGKIKVHRLTEQQRQSTDSSLYKAITNSAVAVESALGISETDSVTVGTLDDSVVLLGKGKTEDIYLDEAIEKEFKKNPKKVKYIAFNNKTVAKANKMIREQLYGKNAEAIVEGEEQVILYSNHLDPNTGYTNGRQFTISSVTPLKNTKNVEIFNDGYSSVIYKPGAKLEEVEFTSEEDTYKLVLPTGFIKEVNELVNSSDTVLESAYHKTMDKYTEIVRLPGNKYKKYNIAALGEAKAASLELIPFTYAYAITTYKSQGQTIDTVFYDSTMKSAGDAAGAAHNEYTAMSRAKKKLYVVNDLRSGNIKEGDSKVNSDTILGRKIDLTANELARMSKECAK